MSLIKVGLLDSELLCLEVEVSENVCVFGS